MCANGLCMGVRDNITFISNLQQFCSLTISVLVAGLKFLFYSFDSIPISSCDILSKIPL